VSFDISVFYSLKISEAVELLITETTRNTWIVMALLLILALYVRIKSRSWDPMKKPTGFQNFIEMCVDGWEKFYRDSANDTVAYLAPWFFTLVVFIAMSNLIGITGLRPPTADWGMTFPLALSSFFVMVFVGLRHRPKDYLKGIFLEPVFVFAPLNLIGELAKPIALSFRLFGNLVGGMILVSLLYAIPYMFVIPVPIHLYFDIASGILQAVIFTVLSVIFAGTAAE